MREVKEKRDGTEEVNRCDMFLFSLTKIPTEQDEEKMIQYWLEAVRLPIKRQKKRIQNRKRYWWIK